MSALTILTHSVNGTHRTAVFSQCSRYRYGLIIEFNPVQEPGQRPKILNFVMLNPSTADEMKNDPTVEGCERRAREWGYDEVRITNLFALRATDPNLMKADASPIGPENDTFLLGAAQYSDLVICAWGNHGEHLGRGEEVARMLRHSFVKLHALKLNKSGHPQHPLYIARSVKPTEWIPNFSPTSPS